MNEIMNKLCLSFIVLLTMGSFCVLTGCESTPETNEPEVTEEEINQAIEE